MYPTPPSLPPLTIDLIRMLFFKFSSNNTRNFKQPTWQLSAVFDIETRRINSRKPDKYDPQLLSMFTMECCNFSVYIIWRMSSLSARCLWCVECCEDPGHVVDNSSWNNSHLSVTQAPGLTSPCVKVQLLLSSISDLVPSCCSSTVIVSRPQLEATTVLVYYCNFLFHNTWHCWPK